MWCTLQVRLGHEHVAANRIRGLASDILQDCFVLERQALRRVQGVWTLAIEIMYPGYIFLVTTDSQALQERLKGFLSFGRLLETDGALNTLDSREAAFIASFGGPDHIVHLSRGSIVNGELVVHEGPLQGHTSLIRKIDRHKRIARLDIGGARTATVGLEVVSKS